MDPKIPDVKYLKSVNGLLEKQVSALEQENARLENEIDKLRNELNIYQEQLEQKGCYV